MSDSWVKFSVWKYVKADQLLAVVVTISIVITTMAAAVMVAVTVVISSVAAAVVVRVRAIVIASVAAAVVVSVTVVVATVAASSEFTSAIVIAVTVVVASVAAGSELTNFLGHEGLARYQSAGFLRNDLVFGLAHAPSTRKKCYLTGMALEAERTAAKMNAMKVLLKSIVNWICSLLVCSTRGE